jgi:hypothetical protein
MDFDSPESLVRVKVANIREAELLLASGDISFGTACSVTVHFPPATLSANLAGGGTMESTFAAAIEHIKVMETRIRQQSDAISLLKALGQNTTDADRRLNLLTFALGSADSVCAPGSN